MGNDPALKTDPTGLAGGCEMCYSDLRLGMSHDQAVAAQEGFEPYSEAAAEGMFTGATLFIPGGAAARVAMIWRAQSIAMRGITASLNQGKTLVLYSGKVPKTGSGEFFVKIAKGWTPKFNAKFMRAAIKKGRAVKDTHLDEFGGLAKAKPTSTLYKEREMLKKAGWKFDRKTGTWKTKKTTTGCTRTRIKNACNR